MLMKIKIGISSCLLGEKVRYDGGHKLDHYLKETLGQYVEWIPVCPEVECGLPIPREAMRIVKEGDTLRLETVKSKIDHTERMQRWIKEKLKALEREELSGFVFKSKSPSSALFSAKVYSKDGKVIGKSAGFFGKAFTQNFPQIPVEEDGRLQNPWIRENFIERVFIYQRWQNLKEKGLRYNKLIEFHASMKLTILSHSPNHYKRLGRLIAEGRKDSDIYDKYFAILMEGLKLRATIKKNTNVLYHIMGYFKKLLTKEEKEELIELIENYHKGLIPLIVPITLLNHYVKKFHIKYLENQFYLDPFPSELMLRNHV
ncbi:MAG: DUF523 and DUF1722 domain-containing protein [Proteobacteria bacterium]|nr:DUF523 and DUF1722 domain-containing protein [Pseudomonadota bacterium]